MSTLGKTEAITSPQNPKFRIWKSLLEPSGIKKQNQFLAAGNKLTRELAARCPELVIEILATEKAFLHPESISNGESIFRQKGIDQFSVQLLSHELFSELDVFGTKAPILVLNKPTLPTWDSKPPPEGLEILLPLGDPSNLGSAIRSACGFGAQKIVLLKEAATPFLPKAIRASSGLAVRAPLFLGGALDDLGSPQQMVALDLKGESIYQFKWPKNVRILIGEEGPGLKTNLDVRRIHIPMAPEVESFNAAMSATVAMFSYRTQHSF